MDEAEGPEFPPDFIATCRAWYARPTRDHPEFSLCRRDGRSFPTDYGRPSDADATVRDHVLAVNEDLGARRTRLGQAGQSTRADLRVFAGPSDLDIAALPHVEESWWIAEYICDDVGIRADTWTRAGLRHAHLRYGVLLDWATRDVAQRLGRERNGLAVDEAWDLYGLDPIRVALEHGAEPDVLDELAARAGLRERGTLSPVGPTGLSAALGMRQSLVDRLLRRGRVTR